VIWRAVLGLTLLLLTPGAGWAASTFDTSAGNRVPSGNTTVSTSITVGSNSNRVLIALVESGANLTYTLAYTAGSGGTWVSQGSVGTAPRMELFCSIAPSTGSVTVQATASGDCVSDCALALHSWFGADQTTPCSGYTSGAGSVALSTANGDGTSGAVVSGGGNPGNGTGCNSANDTTNEAANFYRTSHCLASGGTTTMSWAAGTVHGVAVKQSGSSTPGVACVVAGGFVGAACL
jgi:hypothetical protein